MDRLGVFYICLDSLPLAVRIDSVGSAIAGWMDFQEPR